MAENAPFDPFSALGLPRDASTATIKAKYRQLARKYHPNRHQGPEESKVALADQFHTIHQAWKYLLDPDRRRRYLEFLRLAEEHDALLARMADLLADDTQSKPSLKGQKHAHDGYISSDVDDDDLPQVGLTRRRTILERSMASKEHRGEELDTTSSPKRKRSLHSRATIVSVTENLHGEGDYFSQRRKKLEKLRRKELAAFEQYKNAMVEKFQMEFEAERAYEQYDTARWKREYFERAPRETAERMRSFQRFMGAFRAFGQPAPRRRNRSTVSYGGQILSTEDILESGTYLAPDNATSPSKAKPLHRRGWSSDISRDQSSSDDNSSGPTTPRPGTAWTWRRRHSRNTSLDAFQLPSITESNGNPQNPVTQHAPFKMVVKQPTGFGEHLEDDDSSPESNSAPSRSHTPIIPDACPTGFTLVHSPRLSQLFQPGRSRSPSPSGRGSARADRANGALGTPSEAYHFTIKKVHQLQHHYVPMDHVHVLKYAEKSRMLGVEPDADADPADLLRRLGRLDGNVADRFMVKPDTKQEFTFRLVYDHREVVKDQHQSFIALSYRRRQHVDRKHDHFTLPLQEQMFQALWDERANETEGVWIDQICIDQDSRVETTISMSAMDMVYRSARLVVVALDDIVLDAREAEVLESHMAEYTSMRHVPANKRFRGKQPPYLDTHDELYQVLQKILRSSWFKRAWCRHEMRLARDHVFLIPCNSTDRNIVRSTSNCLTHLLSLAIEVAFEPDIELVKPALHAFFRDRSKLVPQDRHLRAHHGNFTTVVAEVFGMEAGGDPKIPAKQRAADAMKDKISIILNTMECGLAITPEMRDPGMLLTKSECHYMLLTLALAAQDPGALCSVGPPMRLMQADTNSPLSPSASSTWLFEPTNVDAGLNNYRTLSRLSRTARIDTGLEAGEHFVRLDLKFFPKDKVQHGSSRSIEVAHHFVEVCRRRRLGRNRSRYLIADASSCRHFGNMADVYVQTLACIFECGPDWVEEICHRYGVSRWMQDGEGAWGLLVALKNTDGRWPEEAWNGQAAGFIMDLVNFLIIRGMPQRQILHHEEWRPVWAPLESGGKIITFIPPGDVQLAVPTALLDSDYAHLARLWLLEARILNHGEKEQTTSEWTLLGKSVIFSDDAAMEQLHSVHGPWQVQQKVFGRENPEIQRLLRERSLYL